MKKQMLYTVLKLSLNEKLRSLLFSRIEYHCKQDLKLVFSVAKASGGFEILTEEAFAKAKGRREIGIIGNWKLVEALKQAETIYPNAHIVLMRHPARCKCHRY